MPFSNDTNRFGSQPQRSQADTTGRIPVQRATASDTAQNPQATRVFTAQQQASARNSGGHFPAGAQGTQRAVGMGSAVPQKNQASTPKKPRGNAGKIAAAVVAGVLVVAYIAGVAVFSNLYYPNTTIAGVDVSMATVSDAAERIQNSLGDYTLHVTGDGMDWTYTPAEGTFSIDAQAEAQSVMSSDSAFAWPVRLVQSLVSGNTQSENAEGMDVKATYDTEDFSTQLTAAVDEFNANRTGTFDSAGAYDADAGKFTVEKARSSQRLSADAVSQAATSAIESAQATCTLDDSAYEQLAGGATDEQLQAACDAANEILGVNVNITMGGTTVATLDGSQMCQWITFDDSLTPQLNSDQLTAWVSELASSKLDTTGTTRTYTRADGKQITVSGGTYGWTSDEATLITQIQEAVANKQTGDIEVPTKQTAAVYNGMGGVDWGAYVDVDLGEQHAYYYDASGNLLWESGIISGNPNEGNATPTGVYSVNSKETNVQLTGKKDPTTGEPIYVSYVTYWMAFIGGAVGLHDADWQASSSFSNPSAYLSVGSHGCVNLPPAKAEELYNMISVGDCVIVHD